ncbi:uncharacterized protein A4U43_C08F6600 [Asparagus officinalis]|uniref:protein SUPPRESSOR OF GENE SILENCING 3 homolog n=1 Tax=Asparagus officinalis TaxID=4686 RepID=UPI00098E1449|nr:protein SUPPRESSOR OF GENE SILENCING 3 homolog [Asparagus officinalis]ONK59455.1 uncharacterized protein A4U43_C08F6600 [Asparagus officinalis]
MSDSSGSSRSASSASSSEAGNGNQSVGGIVNEGSDTGGSSLSLDQLNRKVADTHIDSTEEGWEVVARKSKNQAVSNAEPWGSSTVTHNAWGHLEGIQTKGWGSWGNSSGSERKPRSNCAPAVDSRKPAGRGDPKTQQSSRGWEAAYTASPRPVPPPLHDGWKWATRGGSLTHLKTHEESAYDPEYAMVNEKPDDVSNDDEDDDDSLMDDSDSDLSDDIDSDASEKSHETRKRNKWFRKLFEEMDGLKVEEITDPNRRWHCPACHDGPGAIDWYRGLQPLLAHAKTRGARRVKLHRELAVLLEEEFGRRGMSGVPVGEVFGKWKGLCKTTADHEIVWPPMVVIMNTLLEKDDNDKWIGMGNQELVDYFSDYTVLRARHSYGPNGHRGMSVLIFEQSATGYMEAERLHKQFVDEGRDRDAWERYRMPFYHGGQRQLYGFLARKEDMDTFNQHSAGKSRLKFDTRSYQEMVVRPMREMSEDKQKLNCYKIKALKQEQQTKAYEESLAVVSRKLRETLEENRIVRQRTKMHYEENKEEMDYQERFFKEQIEKIQKATEDKEKKYEELLQKECAKARQSDMVSGSNERREQRRERESFISSQIKGVEEFGARREKLIQTYERKKLDLKRKQLKEDVKLEEEFHTALNQLMEEFTPGTFNAH